MIRLVYNLLFPIVLLAFLPGYLVKMFRRGSYRKNFGQRLGFYDHSTREALSGPARTWVHAVSVGEVMIALKLTEAMKRRDPDLRIALTTTTTTGFALASRRAPDWVEVLYTPLDFWPIMRRAYQVIRPQRVVLVEAEIWPNMATLAARGRIPFALVNARLSPRSAKRFQTFNWLLRPYFQKLDLVAVQEPDDVARWTSLGVNPDRIQCLGSIKFDPEEATPNPQTAHAILKHLKIDPSRPILLAGSTHPGEEKILARVFLELRTEFPSLFLIIAPRHVERAREIGTRLQSLGLTCARRSQPASSADPDCLLLDSTGELSDWYSVATVVFIGKSLTAHGGQNPVEAIVSDRAVVFGPHMENFAALARALVTNGGAVQLHNETELSTILAELLRDVSGRERLTRNARSVLQPHRGATERTAILLQNLRSTAA